jgi:stage V sporulation protein AB
MHQRAKQVEDMILKLGSQLIAVIIGLASGIVVGSGVVAFLVVLNIIPRLAQLTHSRMYLQRYEVAVVLGALGFTWMDMFSFQIRMSWFVVAIFGLLAGAFVGMLAAALTEVVNVIPIMAKRLGLEAYVLWLLMAMIFGKVVGSWVGWYWFLG